MNSRVTLSRTLPSPVQPSERSRSPRLPVGEREENGHETPTVSGPDAAPSVSGWATASGVELYRRVQGMPDTLTGGSGEPTPRDLERAKAAGVGRHVDLWA